METGDEVRDQRKIDEERETELAGVLEELKVLQDEASQKLHEVRCFFDSRIEKAYKRLPIEVVGEHDQDYLEEKRKHKQTRARERAHSLHQDLTASIAQRAKAHERKVVRSSAAEGAEKELMGLRLEVDQLMKAKAAKVKPKAVEALVQNSAPSVLQVKREVMATAPVKAAKPAAPKRPKAVELDEEEMGDFLGPSKLRRASTGIRLGSWVAEKAQAPAKGNLQAPPQRIVKSRSLKALFA